jgi:hypothetical protein
MLNFRFRKDLFIFTKLRHVLTGARICTPVGRVVQVAKRLGIIRNPSLRQQVEDSSTIKSTVWL